MYDTYEKKGYHATVITLKEVDDAEHDAEVTTKQITLLTEEINKNPYDPVNYYNRGLMLACSQDFEKAVNDFDKAIMFDPDYTMAYFCRANTRYKLIELIKSYYDYKHPFNPVGNKKPTIKRDTTYIKQEYKKVINDFNRVEILDPGFYFTYYNKGYVKSMEGDYWGAVSDFSKAIKYDEKFAEAYYNRGLILLFLKMNNRACNDLSAAGELGATDAYRVIKRYCSK
jgi:tetratricopeptide (TPR) repeat protein